jgi:hypothetical protein
VAFQPASDRLADRVGLVLGSLMPGRADSFDLKRGRVFLRPCHDLRGGYAHPLLDGEQQLGHLGGVSEPPAVGVNPVGDVSGLAVEGDLAWPLQQRPPRGRVRIRRPVDVQVLLGDPGLDAERRGKGSFNGEVLLQQLGLADSWGA